MIKQYSVFGLCLLILIKDTRRW